MFIISVYGQYLNGFRLPQEVIVKNTNSRPAEFSFVKFHLFAYFIVLLFRSQILWHLLWLDALLYLFLSLRGFCFFNSVAIAAKQLQQKLSASKILIVDWVREN